MILRKKKYKDSVYYQIVEHYKDENGKLKQRVLLHLGQIEKIYEVFKAHKETLAIIAGEKDITF